MPYTTCPSGRRNSRASPLLMKPASISSGSGGDTGARLPLAIRMIAGARSGGLISAAKPVAEGDGIVDARSRGLQLGEAE